MDTEKKYISSFLKNLAEDNFVQARRDLESCIVEKMKKRMADYETSVRESYKGNLCWVGGKK